MSSNNEKYTVTFDEKVKGWTSFHSYYPDMMLRLNNIFYTIKEGQLYEHHIEGIGYNNFYGVPYTSKITTIINDESSYDKVFKTLVLESINSWKAELKTNYTESHLTATEFNQRESRWFAYLRKNENSNDLHKVAQGLGNIESIDGLQIEFGEIPSNVSIDDVLYQSINDSIEKIGTITDIQGSILTVDAFFNAPNYNEFTFSKKDPRIEGGEMRGYYLEVTLEDETNTANELFGISIEAIQSFL